MIPVWQAALGGMLLGLSLALPPGPVTAVMMNAGAHGRLRESLATAAGAIGGDAIWLALAATGAATALQREPRAVGFLGLLGASLLLWMAWRSWTAEVGPDRGPGSFRMGFFIVLTSPFSLAWWLGNGTLLFSAWGLTGIVALFLTTTLYSVAFSLIFWRLGTRAGGVIRFLSRLSTGLLTVFGLYVAWTSLRLIGV